MSFYTEIEKGMRPFNFLGQIKEHLSELLDGLKEDEWTLENINKVLLELMSENPLSFHILGVGEFDDKRECYWAD